MQRFSVLLVGLALAGGVVLPAAARPNRADVVRTLSHRKFSWMQQRDTAALATLLHPALRYIHSNGWIESSTDVLRDLADSTLVYHSVIVSWDTATAYSRYTVGVMGRAVFDVSLRGVRGQFPLLYTEVYCRMRHRWMLVQRHACRQP